MNEPSKPPPKKPSARRSRERAEFEAGEIDMGLSTDSAPAVSEGDSGDSILDSAPTPGAHQTIPAAGVSAGHEPALGADHESAATFADVRLLFVEDDEPQGAFLVTCFNHIGIKDVAWVRTAAEAIALLSGGETPLPTIMVVELILAGTNGIQLLAKIRAHEDERVRQLPVIALVSADSGSIFQRATNQSISGYLKKPIEVERLRDALLKGLAGEVIAPPANMGSSWAQEPDRALERAAPARQGFFSWILSKLFGLEPPPAAARKAKTDLKA